MSRIVSGRADTTVVPDPEIGSGFRLRSSDGRVEVDANLFDLGDAAALEQALCGDAVGADGGAIHYDFGHEGLLVA